MRRLTQIEDRLLSVLAILGAIAILALMMHVVVDITLRNVSNSPIPATSEIVTNYYMVALAFIPLAWVERSGGMVQVEVLEGIMGPRLVALSDRIVALLSTVIYGALAWVTYEVAIRSMYTGPRGTFIMVNSTRLLTWPAFWLPPLGFGLAALVTFIRLLAPRGSQTRESRA
ncbi:MAG: TRAP transporter small permease [Rhodobacteraceae bacterium]|nr:TRAP transporter small permease [Paracoccaceae bacterium]